MTFHDNASDFSRRLQLTKPVWSTAPDQAVDASVDEGTNRALVNAFYERVRDEDSLGPVFARHVTDWSHQLPKMHDFEVDAVAAQRGSEHHRAGSQSGLERDT